MGKYIAPILIVLAGMGVAAFVMMYKNTTPPPSMQNGTAAVASVRERAVAAYNGADLSTALPLLKEWQAAEVQAVKNPLQPSAGLKLATAYVFDVETFQQAAATQPGMKFVPKSADTVLAAAEEAAQARTVVTERTPHEPIKPGEVRLFGLKELGNFTFNPEKDSDVPADVKALNGQRVKLRGFMIPLTQVEEVTDFALVPDLFSCCFGQPPGPNHTVTARTPKDKTVNYVIDEVIVEGTLKVNVKREDNYTYSIFELEAQSVKLAPVR